MSVRSTHLHIEKSLTVDCPRCGAIAGARCTTQTMVPAMAPHIARSRMARRLGGHALTTVGEAAFIFPNKVEDDAATVTVTRTEVETLDTTDD